jgi:hypothetical protein
VKTPDIAPLIRATLASRNFWIAHVVPSERRAAKIRQKSSQLPKQDATLAIYDDPGVPGN